jgi:hypothetical protein
MKCKKAATIVTGLIMAVGVAAPAMADSGAKGAAIGSPGFLSGNVIQVPIHAPVNVCGNSIGLISILNPTFGNTCINR